MYWFLSKRRLLWWALMSIAAAIVLAMPSMAFASEEVNGAGIDPQPSIEVVVATDRAVVSESDGTAPVQSGDVVEGTADTAVVPDEPASDGALPETDDTVEGTLPDESLGDTDVPGALPDEEQGSSDDEVPGSDGDVIEDEVPGDAVDGVTDVPPAVNEAESEPAPATEEEGVEEPETDRDEESQYQAIKDELDNKTFLIQSGTNNKQVFDVANGSTSNGANVQTYESNMTAAQKWQFKYVKDGYFTIHLAGTNMVLDVANGLASSGANVQIYTANGTDAQLWRVIKKNNSYIFVSGLDPELVLDLSGAGKANGTNVQIWSTNGSVAQTFYLIPTDVDLGKEPNVELKEGDGSYIIVAGGQDSNKVLDISSGSSANGANVQLWDKNGSNAQKFYFKSDGKGHYTIYSLSSGKVLDADKGNLVAGTNVQQWESNGAAQQKWVLRDAGDGAYYLINVANGLALDVASGQFVNGANVWVYTQNYSPAQKFWIIKVENAFVDADDAPAFIDDGVYIIESSSNLAAVIDVANGSTASGANVQLYESNMSTAQRWQFTHKKNGYYTITLAGTNKVLDVSAGSFIDGTNVQIYTSNDSDSQLWKLVKRGDTYMIVSKLRPDLVIDLASGRTLNGTNVQVFTANGTAAQKFFLLLYDPSVAGGQGMVNSVPTPGKIDTEDGADEFGGGSFIIVSGKDDNGKYAIDIASGALGSGANVQIYENNKTLAQRFYFKRDSEGFYTITVIGTGKVLDVKDGNIVQTTNVQQWDNNGSDAQKWALIKNSDGSYTFINKATGMALDVSNGVFANGSNIQVYRKNESDSQKFWLVEANMLDDGYYMIGAMGNANKVFDIVNGSSGNGAKVQIYDSNNTLAQRFELVYDEATDTYRIRTAASGGWITASGNSVVQNGNSQTDANDSNSWRLVWNGTFFSLLNVGNGKVIALGGSGVANGSALTFATVGGKYQHFLFISTQLIANGLYEIHAGKDASLNLDVAAGSSSAGANIQVYKDNNSAAQKFYITAVGKTKDGEDIFIIKNFKSGKVLDVKDGSSASGANVQQWDTNNSNAQKWLVKIADGGGIVFINVGSGHALTIASNNNVNQTAWSEDAVTPRTQAWTIETTKGYGWISQDGAWFFYYEDGTSQQFSNAAYSAYQAIQNWTSKTNYLICIDNANFRTIIFKGQAGKWEPIKDWICSVGTTNRYDPTYGITARGVFEVLGKGSVMGNDPDYYYWTEFFIPSSSPDGEGQRFHSTGYYRGTGFPGVQYDTTIGHAETHGCVRLWLENAKWIYDNIPIGTKVYSYPY